LLQGASEVKVTLLDQSSYTARVVGAEPDKDVAVLQLDMPKAKAATLQPVTLGMSSNLLVGQKVRRLPIGFIYTQPKGQAMTAGTAHNGICSGMPHAVTAPAGR
jgi:S1-C subfamily serine protease